MSSFLMLVSVIASLSVAALSVSANAGPPPALSSGAAVEDLIGQLRSPDAATRASAAQRLGEMGAAAVSAIPSLVALLGDQTEVDDASPVDGCAGMALGKIGGLAVDALLKARSDEDPYVRGSPVAGLGLPDDPRATAPLRAALREPADRIRGNAALSLGARNDASAMADLLGLLKSDPSSQVSRTSSCDWTTGAGTRTYWTSSSRSPANGRRTRKPRSLSPGSSGSQP